MVVVWGGTGRWLRARSGGRVSESPHNAARTTQSDGCARDYYRPPSSAPSAPPRYRPSSARPVVSRSTSVAGTSSCTCLMVSPRNNANTLRAAALPNAAGS